MGRRHPVRAAWVAPLAMKAPMQSPTPAPIIVVARHPALRTALPRMVALTAAWQAQAATVMAAGMTITRT
ncbi:hypothetical protein [Komagataeibacter xylinus]|uniref:hypothetical protein n=1 Tax=Komagataeibacter xylinus TaxID=28448 RepID=UPI001F5E5A8D|nr:hypothetical protein [Komagataeibacter xylinus]